MALVVLDEMKLKAIMLRARDVCTRKKSKAVGMSRGVVCAWCSFFEAGQT